MGASGMYRHEQYYREEVRLLTRDEELARQARKATRFLNCKLIRPKVEVVTVEITDTAYVGKPATGYKFQRPGPGRPRICATFTEALHWQMDVFGCGKISPIFA